jgi:hypothetical protein
VDFLALRKELAARCPAARTFDLRYRERIYVGQCEVAAAPAPAEAAVEPPAIVPQPSSESPPPPANAEPASEPTPRPTAGAA